MTNTLVFAALLALAGVLHRAGLATLVGWVPRPFGDGPVPVLLLAVALAQAVVTAAPARRRPHALVAASIGCGLLASPAFTLFGVGWALAYRRVLWSRAPRWATLLFPIATVLGLLTLADAAHLPSLSAAHPWLWIVADLFAIGWFLRALVLWQEARAGLARPRAVDVLAYFLFAPFALVPPYMLALPKLALVTDGVRRFDPAVVRSGHRWLLYGLALGAAVMLLGRLGLDPLAHVRPALRAHDWLLAIPLSILVYPVRAVAIGCAGGALLVGLARCFGVPMGPPFKAPLLARGIADWWRRYNIHFRDLLVDLFWYPIALRLRRRRVRAAYAGCAVVFLAGTAPLHWPREWATYGSPLAIPVNVIVECLAMTLLVGTSLALEQRRGRRKPAPAGSARAWAHRLSTMLAICGVVYGLGYGAGYRFVYQPWQEAAVAAERATTPADAEAVLPALERAVAMHPREPARQLVLARMRALAGDVGGACAAVAHARVFDDLAGPYDLWLLAREGAGLDAPCPRGGAR